MDKKYISELLEKRKRLRNFIKFPHQYEELNENLEDKVKKAKTDLRGGVRHRAIRPGIGRANTRIRRHRLSSRDGLPEGAPFYQAYPQAPGQTLQVQAGPLPTESHLVSGKQRKCARGCTHKCRQDCGG